MIIRKAQTWSFDILAAVFVFLVILILFIGILAGFSEPRKGKLSKDAELITEAMTGKSDETLLEENKLQEGRVAELTEAPDLANPDVVNRYQALKDSIGLDGDFCIYFEDSEGNLVPMMVDDSGTPDDVTDDIYINAVGSSNATVNEKRCGEKYLLVPVCGNGIEDPGEECDDGGKCTGDGSTDCESNEECYTLGLGVCEPKSGDGCSEECMDE